MVEVEAAKRSLRTQVRTARRGLTPEMREQASQSASAVLVALAQRHAATALAAYAAMPDELDPGLAANAWRAAGGVVLLPRVVGPGALVWHQVDDQAHLRRGAYGIPEPDPERCPTVALPDRCLIIVPGIAFTLDGRRLGQGGGFYDRVLADRRNRLAVGAGFRCQMFADLPCESHDQRLDGLVIEGSLVLAPPSA